MCSSRPCWPASKHEEESPPEEFTTRNRIMTLQRQTERNYFNEDASGWIMKLLLISDWYSLRLLPRTRSLMSTNAICKEICWNAMANRRESTTQLFPLQCLPDVRSTQKLSISWYQSKWKLLLLLSVDLLSHLPVFEIADLTHKCLMTSSLDDCSHLWPRGDQSLKSLRLIVSQLKWLRISVIVCKMNAIMALWIISKGSECQSQFAGDSLAFYVVPSSSFILSLETEISERGKTFLSILDHERQR